MLRGLAVGLGRQLASKQAAWYNVGSRAAFSALATAPKAAKAVQVGSRGLGLGLRARCCCRRFPPARLPARLPARRACTCGCRIACESDPCYDVLGPCCRLAVPLGGSLGVCARRCGSNRRGPAQCLACASSASRRACSRPASACGPRSRRPARRCAPCSGAWGRRLRQCTARCPARCGWAGGQRGCWRPGVRPHAEVETFSTIFTEGHNAGRRAGGKSTPPPVACRCCRCSSGLTRRRRRAG